MLLVTLVAASQVSALEQMLKLTDEEVASLPNEQSPMILEFRKMYKENPMIFKKPKAPAAGASDSKKKENAKDPLKPFKDHAERCECAGEEHESRNDKLDRRVLGVLTGWRYF